MILATLSYLVLATAPATAPATTPAITPDDATGGDAPCATPAAVTALFGGTAGADGEPGLAASGLPLIGAEHVELLVSDAAAGALGLLLVSTSSAPTPLAGGVVLPAPPCLVYPFTTDDAGAAIVQALDGVKLESVHCGSELFAQAAIADATAIDGWALTDALRLQLGGPPEPRVPLAQLFPMPLERPTPLTEEVVPADVNGDGIPDLIGLSLLDPEGGVQLGRGDGSFGPAKAFTADAEWMRAAATPDLDGDGDRDLVIAHEFCCPAGLTVLQGNGDGTFVDPVLQATNFGINDVAAADVDDDGDEDVIALHAAGALAVHLSAGTGSLPAPLLFPTADEAPEALILADVDRDGDLDVLMTHDASNALDVVALMRNDGSGFFGAPETTATGGQRPTDMALGDLDEDGIPDLIVVHPVNATYSVLHGAPGGSLTLGAGGLTGDSTPRSVALTHLDDDGHLDAVFAHGNADMRLVVRRGAGTGGFLGAKSHVVAAQSGIPDSVTAVDVDGDGVDELLVADRYMALILSPDGKGGLEDVRPISQEGKTSAFAIELGHFDADGDIDLLTYDNETLLVFLGGPGATFAPPISLPSRHPGVAHLAVADVDGNGLDDVISSWFSLQGFMVQRALGDGLFSKPVLHEVPAGTRGLAAGDFDGDTLQDVVVLHGAWVSLHRGLGDGRFATLGKLPVHIKPNDAEEVLLEDLDGDGRDELLLLSASSFAKTGRLDIVVDVTTLPAQVVESIELDFRPEHVVVGDVVGDGAPDVLIQAWIPATDRGVLILRGNGDGTLTLHGPLTDTRFAGSTALGDVTGDGRTDILIGHRGSSAEVAVHPALGDGTFGRRQRFFSGFDSVEDLEAADVDQDGRLDLLMIGTTTDLTPVPTVLVNRGP